MHAQLQVGSARRSPQRPHPQCARGGSSDRRFAARFETARTVGRNAGFVGRRVWTHAGCPRQRRPRPQPSRLYDVDGRRRREAGNPIRSHRRIRLLQRGRQGACARPARHDAAPAGNRPYAPNVSLRGPRFSPDRYPRRSDFSNNQLTDDARRKRQISVKTKKARPKSAAGAPLQPMWRSLESRCRSRGSPFRRPPPRFASAGPLTQLALPSRDILTHLLAGRPFFELLPPTATRTTNPTTLTILQPQSGRPMTHRFINQLGEGEQISEVYLASEKQLRSNRNGNLYLQVRLTDRTGSLVGMLWNANDKLFSSFENGDYVRATGATQFYQGGLQVIISRIERVDSSGVDEADYVTLSENQIAELQSQVSDMLRGLDSLPLRNLAECFLIDETFMSKFCASPAGVKNHHAYRGGLLEHTVALMELVKLVAPRYPEIDPDMLLMGAFLHDIGKTEELTYERELGYSDEGQLLGHLVQGTAMLDQKIREAEQLAGEPFCRELAMRLKHMILSHHGQLDFGSPKVPMTLEAVALHYLDSLDSKLHNFRQLLEENANPQSAWTTYFPGIQRKLYRTPRAGNDS